MGDPYRGTCTAALVFALSTLAASAVTCSQAAAEQAGGALGRMTGLTVRGDTVTLRAGRDTLIVQIVERNVVRVHYLPQGRSGASTLVLDPNRKWDTQIRAQIDTRSNPIVISTGRMIVTIAKDPVRLSLYDAARHLLVQEPQTQGVHPGAVRFTRPWDGTLFGIDNTSLPGDNVNAAQDIRLGIARLGGVVSAGEQGDGGAPLVYTTRYGLLVDSDGGRFDTRGGIRFEHGSRRDVVYYAIVGDPKTIMHAVADISGHPPMMPKWSLGFMNSQWGSSQSEVERIVRTYRAKQIPLDAFILDFDWKAWGEDHYGEWRWNSTRAPGNVHPDLFPDGASGAFARTLAALGVHVAGIYKPRILLYDASHRVDAAARFAFAHRLFFSWERPYTDYFSGRQALDVDFSRPLARAWFWRHMLSAYRAGIAGFWNDEADALGSPLDEGFVRFPNFQHLNMERAMYEGARSHGDRRVWSLNRNFYLGAQRYAYAQWSGDVETSFDSMREQAIRMLGTIDLAEPHWSMDTGGFDGHPDGENYARWMQFAAFVPIMRVHGTLGEKRQPWVYGPHAEQVAKAAIDLRYQLMPYMYAYERQANLTGAGIVRPLIWDFPDDGDARWVTDEWMFGDELLVAPVFGQGQAHRSVYLPKGVWLDYFRGTRYMGPKTIDYAVDPSTWADIPLFVRSGAIVPTQNVAQYVGERPVTRVYLDVFPADATSSFDYYDDDGVSYAYEKGVYYEQRLAVARRDDSVEFLAGSPTGSYRPQLREFVLRLHGLSAHRVALDGTPAPRHADEGALESAAGWGWSAGTDRYGPVTYVKFAAGTAVRVDARALP